MVLFGEYPFEGSFTIVNVTGDDAPVASTRFVTDPVVGAVILFQPVAVVGIVGAPKSSRNLLVPVVAVVTVV